MKSITGRIGNKEIPFHHNDQRRIPNLNVLLIRKLYQERRERLPSQHLANRLGIHTISIPFHFDLGNRWIEDDGP
ncbi:MAG: hypothetical protein AABZ08_03795 [Planctomycetota bacterium]